MDNVAEQRENWRVEKRHGNTLYYKMEHQEVTTKGPWET